MHRLSASVTWITMTRMPFSFRPLPLTLAALALAAMAGARPNPASAQANPSSVPAPADVKPGSITCEDVPYPYPSSYLPITLYGQDVRMAYMDVAPVGQPNGHTVVLLHGNNFAGFYFGGPIDALRKAGFRVIVPDQIGYGRSSKPIIPYNFHDMARNTRLVLQAARVDRAMVVGHSMGGMLAARFATQYPDMVERLVLYNPIGLTDARFARPWESTDDAYKRTLGATYQTTRAGLMRYVAHNPAAWTPDFESYARIRYSWTLGSDWPRLAMVQTLVSQVIYLDPVVDDWAHIKAPTLVFGGAEDVLPGSAALFKERMKFVAETPDKTYPPLLAFLTEGLAKR
jgi:pimeloyl-ACP methyl ester carboxylesterase